MLVAFSLGASKVLAVGRNQAVLEHLAGTIDPSGKRVIPVLLGEDASSTGENITAACGSPVSEVKK